MEMLQDSVISHDKFYFLNINLKQLKNKFFNSQREENNFSFKNNLVQYIYI